MVHITIASKQILKIFSTFLSNIRKNELNLFTVLFKLQRGVYIRWFRIFLDFKVSRYILWRLQVLEYLRTLSLKFQKARFSWDSQQGRLRTTSIKVLKYSRNCSLHNTLMPNLVKPLVYILWFIAHNKHCHNFVKMMKLPFFVFCIFASEIIDNLAKVIVPKPRPESCKQECLWRNK